MIGDEVTVTVLGVRGRQIRIGIAAPEHVAVHRKEVYARLQPEQQVLGKDSVPEATAAIPAAAV